MKRKLPKSRGIYLEREILASDAFWDLTNTAKNIYLIFLMKRVLTDKSFGKDNARIIANNGEITFTFIEAEKNYNIKKNTFLRARDLLIEIGFIEITELGGCHHRNKYKISSNWKKYPTETFKRPKSGNLVGKKTRWTSKKNV
tara:strand:- start:1394 stop:1822 length:429 start_codon:yes stop_codon:yes gene_type:complete